MALSTGGLIRRLLYGAIFAIGVPALLAWWAHAAAAAVPLTPVHHVAGGIALIAIGMLIMSAGMIALVLHGHGLPMNAFPPPRFVSRGIYRWIAHPIYVGFIAAVLGAAIAAGSASGLWLVSPVAALGATALVLGYERHDLRRRFGTVASYRPRIALPPASSARPNAWDRISVFALVLIPWAVVYEAVHLLGIPADAIDSHLRFERTWPVIEWTEAIYASAYVFVPATVFIAHTRAELRRFAVVGLIATAVVTLLYIVLPVTAPPRPFTPTTTLGRMLVLERALSHTVAAFPAFHVLWALIAAATWHARGRVLRFAGTTWALLIAASCITTGMHSIADVAFAFVIFVPLFRYRDVWHLTRATTERIANSWREWRFGPVRIINHGVYAGAAAAVGLWLAGALAGGDHFTGVIIIAVACLLGAGIWAQLLEGSSVLLRPFGYYGAVAGGLVGAMVLWAIGQPVVLVLAAYTVAAPWVQAVGRLRCLVQGCCHGAPASETAGIRYRHTRSRVAQIAHLAGVPLHATPLYSIASNTVIGLLLLRLYTLAAPPALLLGLYYILNGIARFLEESYRGEPQTAVIGGLRIYQWLAIASVLGGIWATTLPVTPWPPARSWLDPVLVAAAAAFGVIAFLAMGVDFPESNHRFSRLAGTDTPPRLLPATPPTGTSTADGPHPALVDVQ